MKDIKGYEGLYAVTEDGKIFSCRRNKFLTTVDRGDGYIVVGLFKDGKQKTYSVHRLVAEAYIPNPNNYPDVNHIDEIKHHNWVDNLEWCTRKYNMNHGTLQERQTPKTYKPVYCVELDKVYPSMKHAFEETGARNIHLACRGKLATSGGYHWRYAQ